MPVVRTFKPLSELPTTQVVTCSQILLNSLQCWKPGAVLVTETQTLLYPAEDGKEPGVETQEKTIQFQLCRGHASILKQLTDQEAAAEAPTEALSSSVVAAFAPQAQKDKLQAQAEKQQTTIPQGEDSPNNK